MKELCIDIMNANNGELPKELTIEDANREIRDKKFDFKTDERKNKKKEESF